MFLLSLAVAGLTLPGPVLAEEEPEPWKIAVAGPLSGDNAHLGQAMVDAVELRVKQVNEVGGIAGRLIEVLRYDDNNDPETAAKVADDIALNSGAHLVIGHRTSGASIAAGPTYMQYGIPAISGTATAEEVTAKNPWYFRVIYNNKLQADFIANYINSILKFKHVTLISTDSVYGKSLATAFRNSVDGLPLDISHSYELRADDADIDLTLAGIVSELSLVPDSGMVFLAMNADNAAHFVREMRNSGFNFPLFGADSINQNFPSYFEPDPVLKTSQGDFTDQILATTSMIWDVANQNAVNFQNAFRTEYGSPPDASMALYFDAAGIALAALLNVELTGKDLAADRKKIQVYLAEIDTPEESFVGITGKMFFDESGNAMKTIPVGVFQLDELISAPVQMEPVLDPIMVPDFSDKLEDGAITRFGETYVHATQIVYMGIDLNEISNLNTATGDYTLDFYLWLRFRGDLDLDKIEFTNAVGDIKLDNPIWSRERNGMNVVTYKVRGRFHGEFQFKNYPFDKQELVLKVRHRDRTRESLNFVVDRLGMRLTGKDATLLKRIQEDDVFRTSLGWRITDAQIYQDLIRTASTLGETIFYKGETDVNFSRMILKLDISRHLSSYSTTIMLPLTILWIIGMFLFVVPIVELPPRLSGGVLLLVTASLLRARLSNDLPNIGYLVAIDYVFFALQIAMWFGIGISIAGFWFLRQDRVGVARRINSIGALVYPLPVVAAMILIWQQAFAGN